jgi:hypothetical protein
MHSYAINTTHYTIRCTNATCAFAESAVWHSVADTCTGGWPSFASADAIVNSPWYHYFSTHTALILYSYCTCTHTVLILYLYS